MHLKRHDYFADAPLEGRGLEGLADQIAVLRSEATAQGRHCLLLDNGDLLQGTPLGDHLAACAPADDPHPVAQALGALGYDAMGLGNHDLDYGLDYLERFARDLPCPLLSSNLHLSAPSDWLHPSLLLDLGGVRVGLLSVLPERTMLWAHARLAGRATIRDMTTTCRAVATDLRARGADLVVALAHTGIGRCPEENALAMIARTGAVDALIGGHTHKSFPAPEPLAGAGAINLDRGTLHGVPTVMPGFAAEALGCIDLHVARTADGSAEISHAQARLHRPFAPQTRAAPQLAALTAPHHAVRSTLNEELGRTDTALTSYMAQVRPTRLLEISAAAMIDALTPLGGAHGFADLPVLAAVSPARAGGAGGPLNYADIPAGPLRRRHVAELHSFKDHVWGVPVTGAELRDWLEKSAAAFAEMAGAGGAGLLSPAVPAFEFDTIYGLTYEINPLAPPRYDRNGLLLDAQASRITDLRYLGRRVRDRDRFLVAASNYRACGGGQFPHLCPERDMLRTDLPSAQVMPSFVASGAPTRLPEPWRFARAAQGHRTWFDTGPGAKPHLDDIAHLAPEEQGITDAGFLRLTITL